MFYIKPPRGQLALHVLENCVYARFAYLTLLDGDGKGTDSFSGNFEYLLENSTWDVVGHFTLRLIAATSKDLWGFWVRTECLLFSQRIDHLLLRQLHRLFRKIEKNLRERQLQTPVSRALIEVSKFLQQQHVFRHISQLSHDENCRKYQCQVAFVTVPRLVRSRAVELYQGDAIIVCSQWKDVLLCLFESFLNEEKKQIPDAEYVVSIDPRLSKLKKVLHGKQRGDDLSNEGYVTFRNINMEARKFPLCMQNLHLVLRDKHRLSHEARFHYSVFLRECGMQLEDSIEFWKEEYTKPHACDSGCTHNWQTSEKKYLYSIRHLYGLVGGRKTSKTPNCKKICNESPGMRYEGGCPFQHFDQDRLETLLKKSITESQVQELLGKLATEPEVSCFNFFKIVHQYDGDDFQIHSPIQFYTKVKAREE